jgi:palmitoyltransferase
MVLPMHVMFVGAFFILDPTLDWQIHEEPWYDSLSLSL